MFAENSFQGEARLLGECLQIGVPAQRGASSKGACLERCRAELDPCIDLEEHPLRRSSSGREACQRGWAAAAGLGRVPAERGGRWLLLGVLPAARVLAQKRVPTPARRGVLQRGAFIDY